MKNPFNIEKISGFNMIMIMFIALKLALHFLTNTKYELLRDEMLYFNMGEHLSAGYATVPPVTGFLAFLMLKIFGFSVFGIRLFPAIMGIVTMYVISAVVKELGGKVTALVFALSAYLLAPGFLLTGTLFTPNSFEEMIWALATWSIFRMINKSEPKVWIITGILAGLGMLNKYSMLFFVAAFLISIFFSPYRKLIYSKYFLISATLFLAIILPNVFWQYRHGWPVAIHMSELKGSQLDLLGYKGFLVSLYAFCQGSVVIWLAGLLFLVICREGIKYRYLGYASLIVLVLLFIMKGKGYYALVIMPFLISFGGYALEKYFTGSLVPVRNVFIAISVSLSLMALPSGLPVLSYDNYSGYIQKTRKFITHPLLEWDNGTIHNFSQAWSDMTGWKELAGLVSETYYSLPESERAKCTIYGERNYGYAGAIYFYGKEYGLPEAVTFHDSYTFWAPDSIPDGPVIYIYRDLNGFDELFSDITLEGSVNNPYFREAGLKVFLCRSPKKDIVQLYKEKAAEEKKRYGIKTITPGFM